VTPGAEVSAGARAEVTSIDWRLSTSGRKRRTPERVGDVHSSRCTVFRVQDARRRSTRIVE
jgi:hypothetical protein